MLLETRVYKTNYIDAYYHLLWTFYMSVGVNTLHKFNLETPSIWVNACQLRLGVQKVLWENPVLASEKHSSKLIKKADHIFTAGVSNSTDPLPILAKHK